MTADTLTTVEACLPFWAKAAQPVDLPEGVEVLEVPETMFAGIILEGAETGYPQILSGYDTVADWIVAHGFAFAGPAYEIYRRWCGTFGHPDNRLEVGWPIDEAPDAGPTAGPTPTPTAD